MISKDLLVLVCTAIFTLTSSVANADRRLTVNDAVQANNLFGTEFLRLTSEQEGAGKNIFVSPISATLALGMLLRGADSTTEAAIAKALQAEGLETDYVHAANELLLKKLDRASEGFELAIANAVFVEDSFETFPSYNQDLRDLYRAESRTLDFADPASVDIINGWVQEKTRDKIETIVDRLSPQAVMVLLNATYFKADWMSPFKNASTRKAPFFLRSGENKMVDMMSKDGMHQYVLDREYLAVQLPYKGNSASMVMIQPDVSLEDFASRLDDEFLADVFSELDNVKHTHSTLRMPKYKFSFETQMNDTLGKLGMGEAFGGAADFSKMSEEQVKVSSVLQKTFVAVDEKGTEAAAVTGIIMERTTSIRPELPIVSIDRPFIVAIRDHATDAVLFLGMINEPIVAE